MSSSAVKDASRYVSLAMIAGVVLGVVGGIFGISLEQYSMFLTLLGLVGMPLLVYAITDFKMTNMNLGIFSLILVSLVYLLTQVSVEGFVLVFSNIKPLGYGLLGGGLISILATLPNLRFGKGKR